MTPQDAQNEFAEFLSRQGLPLLSLAAVPGIDAALQFYNEVRAEGGDVDADADMLLFQWGSDKGGSFLDITRQFILDDTTDDEGIWQLSLTFRYSPTTSPPGLNSGSEWGSMPTGRDEFKDLIYRNPAYRGLTDLIPDAVVLNYENAG